MSNITKKNTEAEIVRETVDEFAKITQRTLNGMLDLDAKIEDVVFERNQLTTDKNVLISTFFTGVVYGEFILATSESTARKIAAAAEGTDAPLAAGTLKIELLSSLSEILNIISGQAITGLGKYYDKLTLTSPRIYSGTLLYPSYATGMKRISTRNGDIECHFYLDRMQLDLAVSYNEAMESLIGTNRALAQANETLKKQQAQLVHSEKMASLGMMAAGVAHEINNPLAYVDSNICTLEDYSQAIQHLLKTHESLLESLLKKDKDIFKESLSEIKRIKGKEDFNQVLSETRDIFDETRSGIKRIKEIIIGLKKFSHIDQGELKEVDMNDEIENMLKLVANQLKYKCTVIRDYGKVPRVTCYPGQLNQVFVNLLVNAAQAMPEKGGEIRILSREIGGFIEVLFADTGCGIPAENLGKIFDPFFSTKPVGEGTGLGLSISYGIIQKHGGTISVESTVGKGTIFTVRLPVKQDRKSE